MKDVLFQERYGCTGEGTPPSATPNFSDGLLTRHFKRALSRLLSGDSLGLPLRVQGVKV